MGRDFYIERIQETGEGAIEQVNVLGGLENLKTIIDRAHSDHDLSLYDKDKIISSALETAYNIGAKCGPTLDTKNKLDQKVIDRAVHLSKR